MFQASEVPTKPDKREACDVSFVLILSAVTSNDHAVLTGPQATITSTDIVDQEGV